MTASRVTNIFLGTECKKRQLAELLLLLQPLLYALRHSAVAVFVHVPAAFLFRSFLFSRSIIQSLHSCSFSHLLPHRLRVLLRLQHHRRLHRHYQQPGFATSGRQVILCLRLALRQVKSSQKDPTTTTATRQPQFQRVAVVALLLHLHHTTTALLCRCTSHLFSAVAALIVFLTTATTAMMLPQNSPPPHHHHRG